MKIKTATVTWISWNNYGSYLQAYALQRIITSMGYDNAIISDERIVYPHSSITSGAVPFFKRVYIFFRRRLRRLSIHEQKTAEINKRFLHFKKHFLVIENAFQKAEELDERYDIFIAGSDQIWVPTEDVFRPFYYLNFSQKKKISYAVSLNSAGEYPESFKQRVSNLLQDFSYISVREESGKVLLGSFIDKPIEVCLDPTLLLTPSEWDFLVSGKRARKKTYLLCYFLSYNKTFLEFARKYADEHHLHLMFIANDERYRYYADSLLAAGPCEFISAVKEASFILTDSFHGTVFSILYKKEFLTLKRFRGNCGSNQNERLKNLFSITGITGHFADEEDINELISPRPINYEGVAKRINFEREKSLAFLQNALNGGKE